MLQAPITKLEMCDEFTTENNSAVQWIIQISPEVNPIKFHFKPREQ